SGGRLWAELARSSSRTSTSTFVPCRLFCFCIDRGAHWITATPRRTRGRFADRCPADRRLLFALDFRQRSRAGGHGSTVDWVVDGQLRPGGVWPLPASTDGAISRGDSVVS